MTTSEDIERRLQALEMDLPTRRGIITHLHDLDQKFQRLDEGQQRLEHGLRQLEHKVDHGLNQVNGRLDQVNEKLDALLVQSKINLD